MKRIVALTISAFLLVFPGSQLVPAAQHEFPGGVIELLETPSIEEMKRVLANDGVLILPMDGQVLENPYYTEPGPERHMLVVVGYDDATEEFITNDPGTRRGAEFRYSYENIFIAMRDYPTGDVLAIETLKIILSELGQEDIPIIQDKALNERHYGALQGKNKAEIGLTYGERQLKLWRRSYDVPPPKLEKSDPRYPGAEARYKDLSAKELPLTECLKDTVERFLPYWHKVIAPAVKSGKRVIIAAHGNSLRALVKYLDNISDEDIVGLNIPTGLPLVYELDDGLKPIKNYYLGDPDEVKKAMDKLGYSMWETKPKKAAERPKRIVKKKELPAEALKKIAKKEEPKKETKPAEKPKETPAKPVEKPAPKKG